MKKRDFLIIGQGLAGSLLAWQLMQRGKSVYIVDGANENASKVAAGLINPMTGMRFVKNNDIEKLLDKAKTVYTKLEQYFDEVFYNEMPMLRVLKDETELTAVQKRLNQSDYSAYISSIIPNNDLINTDYGIVEQKQTAWLNIPSLLEILKQFFIEKTCYEVCKLDPKDISLSQVTWNGMQFNQVVFCQGHELLNNPYFNWLPLKPVKGEILTVKNNLSINDNIINYGYWFIPIGDNAFRTGATFDRENINTKITEAAREELLESMKKNIPSLKDSVVLEQRVGIRPTTVDRAPMLGQHPNHSNLYVFNGFGTKGSLLIPYYSELMVEHLLEKKIIPPQVNINRFVDEYFTD